MSEPRKMSATFCILPWIHRFTNVGGEIQVCCTSEEHDNAIRDENGRPLMAPEDLDDEKIMNSPVMRQLRLDLLAGKWPEMCKRCEITEASGALSRRQTENLRFQPHVDWATGSTKNDGRIPLKVVLSDFRLGNLCNLACRMCNPRSSSRWIRDAQKLSPEFGHFSKSGEELKEHRWFESEGFSNYLESQLSSVENLHFAGGEPLISKKMIEILRLCVRTGNAKRIELSYNTNLTRIPEEIKELWPEFRGVRLYCSVDAVGKLNDLIRHPSRWEDVDRNLRMIDREHQRLGVVEAQVMCTVQVLNALRLGELYDYLSENFSFVAPVPHLIDLHFPPHYQTTILPPELKALALKRMREIQQKSEERIREGKIPVHCIPILESLVGSIGFIQTIENQTEIKNFIRATEALDALRQESVYQIVPELRFLKL